MTHFHRVWKLLLHKICSELRWISDGIFLRLWPWSFLDMAIQENDAKVCLLSPENDTFFPEPKTSFYCCFYAAMARLPDSPSPLTSNHISPWYLNTAKGSVWRSLRPKRRQKDRLCYSNFPAFSALLTFTRMPGIEFLCVHSSLNLGDIMTYLAQVFGISWPATQQIVPTFFWSLVLGFAIGLGQKCCGLLAVFLLHFFPYENFGWESASKFLNGHFFQSSRLLTSFLKVSCMWN